MRNSWYQYGKYDGKQVVAESWINEMTATKVSTNNDVP